MVSEDELTLIRQHMHEARAPSYRDKVYKEECAFSFATPLASNGLFLNLNTWQAVSEPFLQLDRQRTNSALYLWEKWKKVPLTAEEKVERDSKVEKMALGGEGGFQVDEPRDYTIEKETALVVMPSRMTIPLPCPHLPEVLLSTITAVMAHDSVGKAEDVQRWEEERRPSRYAADLEQLPATKQVSPDPLQWRCEETGDRENLWLNLSTGYIGSGRPQWGGGGGNGSALRHFEATGRKYPLAVKLGTITPHGADVYSYAADEDDMVTDPLLSQHLRHWGINMLQMEKTEKTMAELEIDQNIKFEFDSITEAGAKLKPLSGPGYVGLTNLGNSCYMNSVLQMLWSLPLMQQRFAGAAAAAIFETAPQDPASDLFTQMAKVGFALTEGQTGDEPAANDSAVNPTQSPSDAVGAATGCAPATALSVVSNGTTGNGGTGVGDEGDIGKEEALLHVRPHAFKSLVGRGHPEFSSARQQDAVEYLEHLMQLLGRAERTGGVRLGPLPIGVATPDAFSFRLERRVQEVGGSRAVSYKTDAASCVWPLEVPLAAAVNAAEVEGYKEQEQKRQKLASGNGSTSQAIGGNVEEPVRPRVPFEACVQEWAAEHEVPDYYSAAAGRKVAAKLQQRFTNFPPYLLVQIRKYGVNADWTPKKLHVEVVVPDRISLGHLRAQGPQPGETLQPSSPPRTTPAGEDIPPVAALQADEAIVAQLVSMGFSQNSSRRAAIATKNAGAEASAEWVFAHMDDADFNDPPPTSEATSAIVPAGNPSTTAQPLDPEAISQLAAMGFTDVQAEAALKATSGSVERAVDWLFSHQDDLDAAVAEAQGASTAATDGTTGGADPHDEGSTVGQFPDGSGDYELAGFVSHMGASTATGHYVVHLKREGRWVIHNDEKVAESAAPPREMGYLYLFRQAEPVI